MTLSGSDRVVWKAAERVRLKAERDLIRQSVADAKPPKRVRLTPAQRKKPTAEQRSRWRKTAREKRRLAKGLPPPRPRIMRRANGRAFIGVDGEGAGTDELGRQNYMLLRAGDRELYTGKPLSTIECLEFLCDCPPSTSAILVGFSFGYDVTMILKDLPSARRVHLLKDKEQGAGLSRYTYWSGPKTRSDGYGIEYLKNNYFRVCRTKLVRRESRDGNGLPLVEFYPRAVKNSSRTIYETFGFFQTSFLKTLKNFDVGTEAERAEIEVNKAERGAVEISDRQRAYCAMECRFLGELMDRFRDVCLDPEVNIRPRTWNGAGKLSTALHNSWDTMTAEKLSLLLDDRLGKRKGRFLEMASAAYYGGRFEVTRTGAIGGPIFEYDIHSAYPTMMARLPCLEHGTWEEASSTALFDLDPAWHTFVAPVRFDHHSEGFRQHHTRQNICGLPVRQKSGRLFWPVQGGGVYWSCEIAAAKKLGCQIDYVPHWPGWRYVRQCDCHMFPWVESLYEARKRLGADLRGYPIKLAINGLYGKLAQRIGHPRFANLIWAGMITAYTRAALMEAAAANPQSVLMFATDGLFTNWPLTDLSIGDKLGQWEVKEHNRLFIVQPGIYWGASRPKMRGVPDSVLTAHTARFESAWSEFSELDRAALRGASAAVPPVVSVPIRLFTGIRIAQARGKPETAGIWTDTPRKFDFDWHAKRGRHTWQSDLEGTEQSPSRHVWTFPAEGAADLWSLPHGGDKQLTLELDEEKAELAEQPDVVDLSIPWAT